MSGKLDEISRAIGSLETSVFALQRRMDDNSATLQRLAEKLDRHAAAVEAIRPSIAALELSRSRLTATASIGIAAIMVFGWIVEAGIKWTVTWMLSHFQ